MNVPKKTRLAIRGSTAQISHKPLGPDAAGSECQQAPLRPKPLNVKQAAAAINVSQSLVYEWCRGGLLRHIRLPGRNGRGWKIVIGQDDLFAFLEQHTVEPAVVYDDKDLKHIRSSPLVSARLPHIKMPENG
jgi:Helix-turn-helix domain